MIKITVIQEHDHDVKQLICNSLMLEVSNNVLEEQEAEENHPSLSTHQTSRKMSL